MAPVVKRSLPEPTTGQSVEVPENDDTETGNQQLSILNRDTEVSSVPGNVKSFLFLKIHQSVYVFS
jgi:hypothetical protein